MRLIPKTLLLDLEGAKRRQIFRLTPWTLSIMALHLWKSLFRFPGPSLLVIIKAQEARRERCRRTLMAIWQASLRGSLTNSFRSFLSAVQVLSKESLATVDTTHTIQQTLFTQAKSASFYRVSKQSLAKYRIRANKKVTVGDREQAVQAPQALASQISEGLLGEMLTVGAILAILSRVSRLGKPRLRTPSTSSLF